MKIALSSSWSRPPLATAAAGTTRTNAAVVSGFKHQAFGRVLLHGPTAKRSTTGRRSRDFKVHCTGSCAKAWPPLIVKRGAAVPRRIAGLRGTFGVVRHYDGRRQLTHNRRPVYTYAHERRRRVLCNDVDDWFVVRVDEVEENSRRTCSSRRAAQRTRSLRSAAAMTARSRHWDGSTPAAAATACPSDLARVRGADVGQARRAGSKCQKRRVDAVPRSARRSPAAGNRGHRRRAKERRRPRRPRLRVTPATRHSSVFGSTAG